MCLDISYRKTGFAVVDVKEGRTQFIEYGLLENPKKEPGFEGAKEACASFYRNTIREIERLNIKFSIGLNIIEMPFMSQDAVSASTIFLCWGMMGHFMEDEKFVFIEPQQLKTWSGSKKGDGKSEVKAKVSSRLPNFSHINKDDIVDAIGIGFLFSDLVTIEEFILKNETI